MKLLKLFFIVLSLFYVKGVEAQCNPACDLSITNKIDCQVQLEIVYTCPGSSTQYTFRTLLSPGNNTTPWTTNGTTLWSNLGSPACSCSDATIVGVRVTAINNVSMLPPVALGASTTTINSPLGSNCCSVNYGTISGCTVTLWMSCP